MNDYADFDEELPDDPFVPDYPTIQWYNKRMSALERRGGLFIPSHELLEGMQLPGWILTEAEFDEKTETGFGTLKADIAVIRTRFRWKMSEGFATRTGVTPEPGSGIRGNLQMLCAVKGCNQPVVITLSGVPSQIMEHALREFTQRVVGEANQTARRRLPKYAFWMTVEARQPEKVGKTKQSTITPPGVSIPETISRDYLLSRYVGDDLRLFAQWYRAAETWATYWETLYPTKLDAPVATEASPEGEPERF